MGNTVTGNSADQVMSDKKITELQLEISRLQKVNDCLTKKVERLDTSGNATDVSFKPARSSGKHIENNITLLETARAEKKFSVTDNPSSSTQMNSVMGMLELILDSSLDDGSEHLIESDGNSEVSLLAIINDILDFSKIKSGKLSLNQEAFDLHELLDNALEQIAGDAQKKNLQLITRLPENVGYEAIGDPARLRQIIVNILHNAVKFTEQGVIELMTDIEIDDRIIHLDVAIRDTGKGIDPAYQTTIFEPFEQKGEVDTIRDFSGTGLGLSITRDLIQLMGGEISLRSTPGEGSTFSFSVELGVGDKTGSVQEDNEIRILLAEDTLANQEIMYEQMDLLGYKIEIVENGLQALEAISQNNYALIFMDIHMPYMDGFAATEAIRAVEQEQNRKPVPIIAVTADLSRDVQLRCKKVGMNNYLSKPFSINDIEEILKTWMNKNSASKPSADSVNKTPVLSSPKDLNRAVIEQLRALSENGDHDTLGNAVLTTLTSPTPFSLPCKKHVMPMRCGNISNCWKLPNIPHRSATGRGSRTNSIFSSRAIYSDTLTTR